MTQQDIVIAALTLLHELAQGESPNASESFDGCDRLSALLAQWELIEQHVFVIQNVSHAMTAAKASYSMGVGAADWNTARPVKIESAGAILGGVRSPLKLFTSKEWAAIPDKAASGLVPVGLYNDNDYPFSTLRPWPIPSGTPTLDLYMWGEFTSFTNILYSDLVVDHGAANKVTSAANPFTAADVGNYLNVPLQQVSAFTPGRYKIASVLAGAATLDRNIGTIDATGGIATYDQDANYPPGYYKAIRYNLAVDLAPEFGRQGEIGQAQDPASIAGIALSSMAALRGVNASNEAGTEQPPPIQQ
jgi:hypothetical protein